MPTISNSWAALEKKQKSGKAKEKKAAAKKAAEEEEKKKKKPKGPKKPKDDWKDMLVGEDNKPKKQNQPPPKPKAKPAAAPAAEESGKAKKYTPITPYNYEAYELQKAVEESAPWEEAKPKKKTKPKKKENNNEDVVGADFEQEDEWQSVGKQKQQEKVEPPKPKVPAYNPPPQYIIPTPPKPKAKPKPKPKAAAQQIIGVTKNNYVGDRVDAEGWTIKGTGRKDSGKGRKDSNKGKKPEPQGEVTQVEFKTKKGGTRTLTVPIDSLPKEIEEAVLDEPHSTGIHAVFYLKVGKQTAVPLRAATSKAKQVVDTYLDPHAPSELQVYLDVLVIDGDKRTQVCGKQGIGELWLAESWLQGVVKVLEDGKPARAYPVWGKNNDAYVEMRPGAQPTQLVVQNNLPQALSTHTVDSKEFAEGLLRAGDTLVGFIGAVRGELEKAGKKKKNPPPQDRLDALEHSLPKKAPELLTRLRAALGQ
eukprot:TRINITY_DN67813_c6_g6_i1.p1 TRINITY_DN67813_c6_g6~~TRINITY_DN67813_c6_g6_i1.p1  ORF type:complete len:476 (-),score=101.16 TRINITY_DN67813_c6_g6_i1:612-2039(-)